MRGICLKNRNRKRAHSPGALAILHRDTMLRTNKGTKF